VPVNRGKRHRRELLHILARLPLNTEYDHQKLTDEAFADQESGTTSVLLSPIEVTQGLGDHARGATVILSSTAPHVMSWFTFAPRIDFAVCMPLEQEI
jgi:hypothetical protein